MSLSTAPSGCPDGPEDLIGMKKRKPAGDSRQTGSSIRWRLWYDQNFRDPLGWWTNWNV